MTQIEIAQKCLNNWFNTNSTITANEFRFELATTNDDYIWTSSWASRFLESLDLEYTVSSDRRYRIYQAPSQLTLQDLQGFCNTITQAGENITKTNLKHFVRAADLPLDNFKELFEQLGLTHNKRYTSDNHKIWIKVLPGKHFSSSKQRQITIKDMPKPYLKNAICKYVADNGIPEIYTLLTEENRELYKLLKAYFTFEMRDTLILTKIK